MTTDAEQERRCHACKHWEGDRKAFAEWRASGSHERNEPVGDCDPIRAVVGSLDHFECDPWGSFGCELWEKIDGD